MKYRSFAVIVIANWIHLSCEPSGSLFHLLWAYIWLSFSPSDAVQIFYIKRLVRATTVCNTRAHASYTWLPGFQNNNKKCDMLILGNKSFRCSFIYNLYRCGYRIFGYWIAFGWFGWHSHTPTLAYQRFTCWRFVLCPQ